MGIETTIVSVEDYQELRRKAIAYECIKNQLAIIREYVEHLCDDETKRFVAIVAGD
jgi:hypothetical protein